MAPGFFPLESFLACCRGDWRPKELKAVKRKLASIGVEDVAGLLRCVNDGTLNERLDGIGERHFTGDTLDAMRSAGVQLALPFCPSGSGANSPQLSSNDCSEDSLPELATAAVPLPVLGARQPLHRAFGAQRHAENVKAVPQGSRYAASVDLNFLDSEDRPATGKGPPITYSMHPSMDDDWDTSSPSRPFTGNSIASSTLGGRWGRHSADHEEAAALNRDICRGLNKMEHMANEAKRRNGEVNKCLAEVQADIIRISERMSAARQGRDRPGGGSREPGLGMAGTPSTPKRNSVEQPRSKFPVPPTSGMPFAPSPGGQPTMLPRRPVSEHRPQRQGPPSQLRGPPGGSFASAGGPPPQQRPPKDKEAGSCGGGSGGGNATRGAQSGFTFGGATPQPRLPKGPPPGDQRSPDPALTQAQQAVRNELLAVRGCPENDRKACVKKLLVKWHPDRNPASTEVATSVFQYIQQEKGRILDI